MTSPNDIEPTNGTDDDRRTRETLALIADRILEGTAPAMPQPKHSTGSQS